MSCNFSPILNNPLKRKNKNVLHFLLLSFAFFQTRYQSEKGLSKSRDQKMCAKSANRVAEFRFYDQKIFYILRNLFLHLTTNDYIFRNLIL